MAKRYLPDRRAPTGTSARAASIRACFLVEEATPVTPCRDLRANRSCRDGVAKRERRSNGGNGSRALADALNGEVAIVHQAAKNALIDIDALDFIETHFKGLPLNEASLMDDPQVGDIGLGGPTVKPSRRRPIRGRKPSHSRQR